MKLKKLLLSTAALLATGLVVTTTTTSCASVSQDVLDNMVDKGDSTLFATDITIDKEFTNALTNATGYDAFKQKLVDDILYDWYKTNKDSQTSYKDNWTKWEKDAKSAYDDKVSSYKSNHKNDWEYYFQNEVLDPVGGTKDAFIRNEIVKNVRTSFIDAVFNTDDLKLSQNDATDERSPTVNTPSKQQISSSDNWNKIGFFSYNDPLFSNDDTAKIANQFAVIQNYVFEKYMAVIRPISTAMCLWKYAAPTAGINSIYNANKIPSSGGDSDKTNTTLKDGELSASYEYPAFAAPTSPISSSQVGNDLYYQFSAVWNDQHNFIDQNNGAINIDKSYTEDSATLMITEGNSAFSSLDISFAGVVSDLWNGYFGNGQTHIHINNDYLNAKLSIPSKYQDTDILSNFFFTNDEDKPSDKYSIDLSKLFEYDGNSTLAKGDSFSSYLFNQNSSPYAKTTKSNGVRYVTPAVRLLGNSDNKLPLILIRDSFGVHVIGLDCASYISSQSDKWAAEANVLKFRSLNESLGYGNQGSGMTLNSKLKEYFSNNADDIILEIWGKKIEAHTAKTGDDKETIFKENLWGDGTFDYINGLINAQSTYFNYYKVLKTLDDANKKLFQNNSKYVKNDMFIKTGNITSDIYKNGLANPLPFVLNDGNVTSVFSIDSSLLTAASTYTASNLIYGFDSNYLPSVNGHNITNLSKKDLDKVAADANNAIQTFWTHNAQPETSKDGMLKYSEHILIKRDCGQDEDKWANDAINAAFNAFGGSDIFSNIVKYNAYTKYINDTQSSIESTYANELTAIYKSSSAFTSDLPLTYYSSSKPITANQLKDAINNAWNSNQYKSIETSGSQNYSSNAINYQLTLATLSWLTNDNNKELINRLQSDVGKNVSAAIVWYEKDLIPFNASFNNQCSNPSDFENIYCFNPNYLGMYDKTYQETDITGDEPAMNKSFVEMSNYYNYATMPYYSGTGSNISTLSPAMNFLGIQTSRSSSQMDTQVSDIIFNRNNQHLYDSVSSLHNPQAGEKGEGSLYQYGSREELINAIEPSQDISEIKSYALNIRNCIPNNEAFNTAVNLIDQGKDAQGRDLVTPQQYKDILLDQLRNPDVIKDEMFKGFNFDDNQIGGVEIKNKSGGAAIRIDGSTYARAYMIQFCNRDLNSTADGDKYENITNHLVKIFGGETAGKNILRSIAVQYAMNSDIQSKAISDIIKKVFNGKKINVYDRRFNDQLGQSWVADWKRTN